MFNFKNSFKKGLMVVGLLSLVAMSSAQACGRSAIVPTAPEALNRLTLKQIEDAIVALSNEKQERQVLRDAGDLSITAEQEACLADIEVELRAIVAHLNTLIGRQEAALKDLQERSDKGQLRLGGYAAEFCSLHHDTPRAIAGLKSVLDKATIAMS